MDIVIISLAILLSIVGVIGCIIPGLPGTPLNYIAMWMIQWVSNPFEKSTLLIYGLLTVAIVVIDYMLPVWFAKKYGATKQGIWGSIIGMLLGIFFTPVGMFLGMIIGAILGDVVAGKSTSDATRSGFATFFGTLLSMGFKLGVSLLITISVIYESINFYYK
ncbi:MAG: DUF456 domain-containing protein [Bacteroidetes bacterium]|nr:DUF456 domain-containing protein [Bacteroidota bacterium]